MFKEKETIVRAAVFNEPRWITVAERPDAAIKERTDAVVRVVLACVCGSDLWYYRGDSPFTPGPIGHEFIGVVEDVGAEVGSVAKGDFVISPFAFSDGTCPHCRHGITSACANGGFYPSNGDGGQGEAVRVPPDDGTLVKVPGFGHSNDMLRSLLTLSDVLATGHHAAVCAGVKQRSTVAVVGDGAVGLSGVLAASRLGAERVVALSRNPELQRFAREFGATDIVVERGDPVGHVDEPRARIRRRCDEVNDRLLGRALVPACKRVGHGSLLCVSVSAIPGGVAASRSVWRRRRSRSPHSALSSLPDPAV
jgi:threonine dehydrogenase-like Zn-dependent dehydrogenase